MSLCLGTSARFRHAIHSQPLLTRNAILRCTGCRGLSHRDYDMGIYCVFCKHETGFRDSCSISYGLLHPRHFWACSNSAPLSLRIFNTGHFFCSGVPRRDVTPWPCSGAHTRIVVLLQASHPNLLRRGRTQHACAPIYPPRVNRFQWGWLNSPLSFNPLTLFIAYSFGPLPGCVGLGLCNQSAFRGCPPRLANLACSWLPVMLSCGSTTDSLRACPHSSIYSVPFLLSDKSWSSSRNINIGFLGGMPTRKSMWARDY